MKKNKWWLVVVSDSERGVEANSLDKGCHGFESKMAAMAKFGMSNFQKLDSGSYQSPRGFHQLGFLCRDDVARFEFPEYFKS